MCVVNAHKTTVEESSLVTKRRRRDESSFDSPINRLFSDVDDDGILCYGVMTNLDQTIRKRKKRLYVSKLSQEENEVEERPVLSKLLSIPSDYCLDRRKRVVEAESREDDVKK